MHILVKGLLAAAILAASVAAHADTVVSFQFRGSNYSGDLSLNVNASGYATSDIGSITINGKTNDLPLVSYDGYINFGNNNGHQIHLPQFVGADTGPSGGFNDPLGFVTASGDGVHFAWNQVPNQIPNQCIATPCTVNSGKAQGLVGVSLDNYVGTSTDFSQLFNGESQLGFAIIDSSSNVIGMYAMGKGTTAPYKSVHSFGGSQDIASGGNAVMLSAASVTLVSLPASAWLMLSGVIGLGGVALRRRAS